MIYMFYTFCPPFGKRFIAGQVTHYFNMDFFIAGHNRADHIQPRIGCFPEEDPDAGLKAYLLKNYALISDQKSAIIEISTCIEVVHGLKRPLSFRIIAANTASRLKPRLQRDSFD